MTSLYFWGIVKGDETDPIWKTLHDHFEKLAREDDGGTEAVVTDRKAVTSGRRNKTSRN